MTNITLSVEKLKEFVALSKFIVSDKSEILPVVKYIKITILFNTVTMTKSNIKSFCQYTFDTDSEDCEFLLEERILILFCQHSKGKNVKITIKDTTVILNDGYYKQKYVPSNHSILDFPKMPQTDLETERIPKEVLDSFKCARMTTGQDTLFPMFMNVYSKDNYVFSSDKQRMYIKKFDLDIPEMSLSKTECQLISNFNYIDFSKSENYNIHRFNSVVYGFVIQEDAKPFDIGRFLNLNRRENYFSIKVEDLINFCDSTISIAGNTYCSSTISLQGNNCNIVYDNPERGEMNELDVEIVREGDEFEFQFNPILWNEVLKSLPYDTITISDEGPMLNLYNSNDKNYQGLIAKIFKQPNE